ncbi:MAG TPA: hypothetical protein VH761_04895 [Ilumatobacteraceae bacterium]|jgi:mercuric ion transport protein
MSSTRDNAAIVGVGAAACAVCCAGPILAFLAAIGLGTALGVAVFGSSALIVGAAVAVVVLRRRRRRAEACSPEPATVAVELTSSRGRR